MTTADDTAGTLIDGDYEMRSASVWNSLDSSTPEQFYAKIEELVASLPADSPLIPFERACAFDSTGRPDKAVPLYEQALALGVSGERRRRSVIQMASSLRNLGRVDEALQLLEAERTMPSDHLDDAVSATLALVLATAAASARPCRSRSEPSPSTSRATNAR